MLPKKSRLTAAEVRDVLASGRSARAGALSAKYIKGRGAKAAAVVSSRVAKSAVNRNRLRRALYEALRTVLPRDTKVVVFLQKPAFDREDVATLCSKLS